MKYFAYCRKSTEDDFHQAQSIETQKRILGEFSINNNLDIVDYVIETKSAKDDGNRPEFEYMLKRFEKGEADGLLVCHIDRISRNWIEAGQISKLHDIGLIKEIRTPHKIYSTAADMFMMGIELASATYYSRNLSDRVKEGNVTKWKKGEYSSPAPLGYINKDRTIFPCPKTKHFIRRAFKLYASGDHSIQQITDILYSEGFRTSRANKKVHKAVIHRILTNHIYYGAIIRNGKTYQGSYKPLITKKLFDEVQSLLNGTNHAKKRKHHFLFSRYLICEKCGCFLTAALKKNKYVYYYCTNGKHICDEHRQYVKEESLNSQVNKVISDITIDSELANLSLDIYANELRKSFKNKSGVSQIITSQTDNLKKKLKRLFDIYLNQEISKEDYDLKKEELTKEINTLKTQEEITKNSNPERTLELLEEVKNVAISLEKMYQHGDRAVKENLLKSVLWNCSIENGNIRKVTYKKPFSYFQNMGKNDDFSAWRTRWDLNPRSSA